MENVIVKNGERFCEDSHGNLIRESQIKEVDLLRDDLVNRIHARAMKLKEEMSEAKREAMADIDTFVDILAAQYDVKMGGNKGNLQLVSFDGKRKIVVSINDYFDFDEKITVAKDLIYSCIDRWSNGANNNLRAMVEKAFRINNGKLEVKRVLELRTLKIDDDPDWDKAMRIITDAIVIRGTSRHLRIYSRNKDGKYDLMNLNFTDME